MSPAKPLCEETQATLDIISAILLRVFAMGVGVMIFWFAAVVLAGDLVFNIHHSMFGISLAQFEIANYCGMGLFKLAVFLFFGMPWLAIKWATCGQLERGTNQTKEKRIATDS